MRGVALLSLVCWIAGCAPDYGHSAFRCDASHGCPDDQTCISGRCRRGDPTGDGVVCGGATCDAATQQCCLYDLAPRCIPAGDVCPTAAALCDGVEDCRAGDRCCADGTLTACDATCNDYACRTDDDCPSTKPVCCPAIDMPWSECARSC